MSATLRRLDGLIVSALQRVDAQGLTLPELVAALPGANRNSIGVALSRLRVAGLVITMRQHPVAINWWAGVPLATMRSTWASRYPGLLAQYGLGMVLAHGSRRARGKGGAATAPPPLAPARKHQVTAQLANRTAAAIRGDGTHEAKPPKPAPVITGLDTTPVQQCPSWKPRFAPTEPIPKSRIGQYDTPPSPWAAAAISRNA